MTILSRTTRPAALLSATLLAASLGLAGCGNSTDAYCDQLKESKSTLNSLDSSDADIDKAFDTFEKLGDEAPDEVADDWDTLNEGVDKFQEALDDAGVDTSDLSNLDPSTIDSDKLEELEAASQELSDSKYQDALQNIEEHAKEECNVDLED
ncbi:hypothetical protein [Nocardioides acrostichi]|uniref:Lipoprotein n=1 Tax=Nocardioides acrostichi TaxID=2784339 RepID=A0A930UZJ3_9ACTN|nr:hypothetical protein [Nocardioides acrostichi]MBF4163783.1 hypothetical protein [Nocardioides acrostichi]